MNDVEYENAVSIKDEISENFINIRDSYLADTIEYILVEIMRPGGREAVRHYTNLQEENKIEADIEKGTVIIYLDTNNFLRNDSRTKDKKFEKKRKVILDGKLIESVIGHLPESEVIKYNPQDVVYIQNLKEKVDSLLEEEDSYIFLFKVRKLANLGACLVDAANYLYSVCHLNKFPSLDLRILFNLKLITDERITRNFLTALQNCNLDWESRSYEADVVIGEMYKGSHKAAMSELKKLKKEIIDEYHEISKEQYKRLQQVLAYKEFIAYCGNLTQLAMNKDINLALGRLDDIDSIILQNLVITDKEVEFLAAEKLKNYVMRSLRAEIAVLLEQNKSVSYERHTIFKIKELLEKNGLILNFNSDDEYFKFLDKEDGLKESRENLK